MKVRKQTDPDTRTLQVLINYDDSHRSYFELTDSQLQDDPSCLGYAIDSAVQKYCAELCEYTRKELNAV